MERDTSMSRTSQFRSVLLLSAVGPPLPWPLLHKPSIGRPRRICRFVCPWVLRMQMDESAFCPAVLTALTPSISPVASCYGILTSATTFVCGRRSFARSGGDQRNRLRILRLEVKRNGECDFESDPLVFPAWVVTGETHGHSFVAQWHKEKHHLVLDWKLCMVHRQEPPNAEKSVLLLASTLAASPASISGRGKSRSSSDLHVSLPQSGRKGRTNHDPPIVAGTTGEEGYAGKGWSGNTGKSWPWRKKRDSNA